MLAERGISTLTKTIVEYDPEAGGKNTDGASEEENL